MLVVWPSIAEGFPTPCPRVTIYIIWKIVIYLWKILILCFVEGNKFIGFIITVTCLPSLKKDVTLPYLNSPWISAIYMRAIQAIFLNDVRSYCEGRKMKRYINVNIKISYNLCSKFWNLGLKIFSIFFSIPKSNFSDAIRSSTKFSYKVLQLILLQSAMVCH